MKHSYAFLVFALLMHLMCGCQKPARELNQSELYTYVTGSDLQPKKVFYEVMGGMAIAEGDILLGTVKEAEAARDSVESKSLRGKGAIAMKFKRSFWSGGVVPYIIDEDLEDQARVTDSMKHIEKNSNIRFKERTDERDYVVFRQVSEGCFAGVGRQGGEQSVSLEKDCSTGNTTHEIMHALGFWHEQSRHDRDDHIKIVWDNIKEENKHNFRQQLNDGVDIGEYDFDSLMHYSGTAFSKNGEATMLRLDGSEISSGNRKGLSRKDVLALAELYPD